MLYLGIDPGIRKLGYALIDDSLTIIDAGILVDDHHDIRNRQQQYERMSQIMEFFEDLLQTHPSITSLGIEKLFFTTYNKQNAEFIYGIRGAICMLCHRHKIKIYEYTPPELKRLITGNGKASKELVQRMIMTYFSLQDTPRYHDAADALGLAYITKRKTI